MCGVTSCDSNECKCQLIKEQLLARVERFESSANRGKQFAGLAIVLSAKGRFISQEHHEMMLKSYASFRQIIHECFESCIYKRVISPTNDNSATNKTKVIAQKTAKMHTRLETKSGNKTHDLNVGLLEIAGHLLDEMEKQFQLKSIGPAASYKLAVLKALECIVLLK
ncbi:MAG: hypothetical protein ACTH5W_18775 [Providencia sp.]|uniref:hypothetical protein n=1 Tax=Providencia sp. TaxID=589 RepID=UPI003F98DC77